jgi:hypothetical protein
LGALIDILADIESFVPMDNFEIPQIFPETLVIWGEKCGRLKKMDTNA